MISSILLLTVLSIAPAQSPGSDAPDRSTLVDTALERFDQADYDGAISAFKQAYQLEHRAADLFNVGRIYEQMGKPDQAREYYQHFLARSDLSEQDRTQGQAHLAALPPPTASDLPGNTPPPDHQSNRSRRAQRRRAARQQALKNGEDHGEHASRRPHQIMLAGSALLPIGVASLASGFVLASSALRNAKNGEQSVDPTTPFEQTPQYELARRQGLSADILLGVGGFAAASGVVLLATGLRLKKSHRRNTKVPRTQVTMKPAGAGLALDIRF